MINDIFLDGILNKGFQSSLETFIIQTTI